MRCNIRNNHEKQIQVVVNSVTAFFDLKKQEFEILEKHEIKHKQEKGISPVLHSATHLEDHINTSQIGAVHFVVLVPNYYEKKKLLWLIFLIIVFEKHEDK